MSSFYQVKTVDQSTLDVDTNSRRVKVAISHTGSLDLDNDVIDKGAFTKTIKERGPSGANLIWHLTDHMPMLKNAVGKFSELFMQGDYLVGVTDIPNTAWGNDVLEFYKTGHINQHSVGFRSIKREPVNAGTAQEHTLIKEILLYEGSAVLWGANPNTPTLSTGKSFTAEEAGSELELLQKQLSSITKSLKEGQFTDETSELLEIQLKQVQQNIDILFKHTQPVKAVEPSGVEAMNVLKQGIQLLTIQNFNNGY